MASTSLPSTPRAPVHQPLTRATLLQAPAVTVLGQLAANQLFEHGSACFWLNQDGQVELVPLVELQLDLVDEDRALQVLVEAGYGDNQLREYLMGRDTRVGGSR